LYAPAASINYWDRRTGKDAWLEKLRTSKTVYVGNLAFYTTEDQIYELFRKVGPIEQVIMGLNKLKKVPCGFCFVKYVSHLDAQKAVEVLNEAICDQRVIRVDRDTGDDVNGVRKYGRGAHGLQWRDEFRQEYDPGRGGEGGGIVYVPGGRIKRPRHDDQPQSMYGGPRMPRANSDFGPPHRRGSGDGHDNRGSHSTTWSESGRFPPSFDRDTRR